MGDFDIQPLSLKPEDLASFEAIRHHEDAVMRSLGVPTALMGPSPLGAARKAYAAHEAASECLRQMLVQHTPPLIRWLDRMLADLFATTFADEIAYLSSRRWEGYLSRQFRGMPGMRFADAMRGVGRN